MSTRLPLLVIFVLVASALGATIYKWVDEKGVTHYSEEPPPGKKAQPIQVQPPAPPSAERGRPDERSWQEKDAEFRKRHAERLEAERREAEMRDLTRRLEALSAEKCARARQDLEVLRTPGIVYRQNWQGERIYLDPVQRAREIAIQEEVVKANCPPR